jgi:autotransporter-associated beta strand protein
VALAAATGLAGIAGFSGLARADVYGNNGGTALNLAASWADETTNTNPALNPPGATDIAQWDSLSAGGTFNLGAATSWQGIVITNPTAAVVLGGPGDTTNGLTIGTSGIDMSGAQQNLTINNPITLGAAQAWNVASGRTLTTSTGTGTVNLGANALTVQGAGNETVGGAVSGSGGSIATSGTGTLTLSVANSYTGGLTVNSGTVVLNDKAAAGTGAITLNGGTLKFGVGLSSSNNYANAISVASATTVNIQCHGSDQVNGSWTTSGGTLDVGFDGGATLSFTNTAVLSGYTGNIVLTGATAGTLRYAGSNSGGSAAGVALDLGGNANVLNNRNSGTFTWGSWSGGPSTTITGSDNSTGTTTYQVGALNASTAFQGTITNGSKGATALTVTGGTLTLAGNNTNTGTTTINSGATLQVGNGGATGALGTGNITNNGALAYNITSTGTIGSAISGSGTVTRSGSGVTTFTGNNSFSGGATINGGTVQVDNVTSAFGTGAVAVNSGGALGGIGNVTAAVSIASGGILAPGDVGIDHGGGPGVGTLSTSSLSLASGSILNYDFSAGSNDQLSVTTASGLFVAGGGINLYQNNTTTPFNTNGTYNIFSVNGGYSGSVTNLLTILDPVGTTNYMWGTNGNFITLTITGGGGSSIWSNVGGGSWTAAANWTGGVPNAVSANATLGPNPPGITAPGNVTLDGNETVGSLVLNSTVGGASPSYTISQGSGGGSLIFDNGASAATLTDTAGTHLISAPVVLNSNTTISVTNSGDVLTISGPISGNGNLAASGSGTLILSGANTYPGTTSINAINLQIGSGGTSGALGGGAVTNNGTLTFNRADNFTVSNAISGSGSLVKNGAGIVTLSGANTYSGATTVNTGTLQIGTGGSLGTGAVTLAAATTFDLNGNNATASTLTGTGTVDDVAGGGSSVLTVGNSTSFQFDGVIKNSSGTVGLTKVGSGTLALSAPQTYTGNTTISAGKLDIHSGASLNGTGTIFVNSTQGLVLRSGVTINNPIVVSPGSNEFLDIPDASTSATLTGAISVSNTPNSGSQIRLGVSGLNSTINLANATVNSGTTFLILTRGNITMTGNASMTETTANDFLLNRAGSVVLTMQNNSSVSAATADMGNNQTGAGALTIAMSDNASFSVAGNFDLENVAASNTSTTTEIDLNGAGTTLAAGAFIKSKTDAGHAATINVDGGTIAANSSTANFMPALGNLTVNVLSGIKIDDRGHNITIAQPLTGAGSGGLTKLGAGTLVLSGTNTYTGNTVVNAGILEFASAASYGSTASLTAAANTAVGLDTGSTDPAFLNLFTLSATPSTGALALAAPDAAVNLDFTSSPLSGPNLVGMSVGALPAGVSYTGTITPASSTYRLGGGGTLTLPNANQLTGANGVVITNGGAVVVSGTNNYTGNTTVTSGSLTIAASGSIANSNNVTVAAGASMSVVGALSSTATVNANGVVTFAGNTATVPVTRTLSALNVGASVTTTIAVSSFPGSPVILNGGNVMFGSGGKIDVTNNELIAIGSATTAEGLITGGTVVSSTNGMGTALGYGASGSNYIIRATLLGDSDLNGNVNVADLANLAGNFGKTSGQLWINGDFDYNGNVNVADLADLAGNFGNSLSTGAGLGGAAAPAALAATASTAVGAAVPEPASLGVVGLIAALGLTAGSRRRRRREPSPRPGPVAL